MAKRKYPELARRLAVATASYTMGYKSMDYVLRQTPGRSIGPYWHELAELIMDGVTLPQRKAIAKATRGSKLIQ
jgi:hypothetical protein